MRRNPKFVLVLAACVCFGIAVLRGSGIISIDVRIDWTNLGLLFGFLSFVA